LNRKSDETDMKELKNLVYV